MVWLLESGAIAVVALAVMAIEAAVLILRGRAQPTPGDVYLNLVAGAALMGLSGLALSGQGNWITSAALLTVALAAHLGGLVMRLKR